MFDELWSRHYGLHEEDGMMNTRRATATPKTRDRQRTSEGLVAAARAVLVDKGFQGFGVNAVARAAGCDKQLIYRYFDGLEGLIDAIGADLAGVFERGISQGASITEDADYADLIVQLILALLETFRSSELLTRIAAWELADPSPLTRRLGDARGAALGRWIEKFRGDRRPPPGIDAPMQNALLIGAVQQIVLSARASGSFAGVALESEDDWERVRANLRATVVATYRVPVVSR